MWFWQKEPWSSWSRLLLLTLLLSGTLIALERRGANNLFRNGRWILGKEAGKHVFYTYEFLFQPIRGNELELTDCMGFQQILYHHPETPERRLRSMACCAHLDRDAYLWFWLRKEGLAALGFRWSNHGRYPTGFYRYDANGEVIEKILFLEDLPSPSAGGHRFRLTLRNGYWEAWANGRRLTRIRDAGAPQGVIGLQGSGWNRRPVRIRNIRLEFQDAKMPSRTWTVREDFRPPSPSLSALASSVTLAGLIVALRRLRQAPLAAALGPESARKFRKIDDAIGALALATSLGAIALGGLGPWWSLPTAFIAAEILATVVVAWMTRLPGDSWSRGPCFRWQTVVEFVLASLVAGLAVDRHGSWVGWRQHPIRTLRQSVSLAALLLDPAGGLPSDPYAIRKVRVMPGRPVFTGPRVYREQRIELICVPSPGSVLDLVYQQQSFRTRGDPQGEALPFHRHLVRWSARPDVVGGVSSRTDNRPLPFFALKGTWRPNETNRVFVHVGRRETLVTVNGHTNRLRGLPVLGFGETGLLVYGASVQVDLLRISPLPGERVRSELGSIAAWLLPVWGALGIALLLRPFGLRRLSEVIRMVPAVVWMPCAYLATTLRLDTVTLAGLGRVRAAGVSLAAAGSGVTLLALVAGRRHWLRRPWLLANVLAVAVIGGGVVAVWHLLPEDHPLRLRLSSEAVVPGANVREATAPSHVPWYHDNRLIGAHTYLWQQRLGGEAVPLSKRPDEVRIFVVGGSQAWGAGAASSRETFAEILERHLRVAGHDVEVFNAAANGAGIEQGYRLYEELLSDLAPDIVLADVGLNETTGLVAARGDRELVDRLIAGQQSLWQAFCAACRRDGVLLILVPEPMCGETPLRPVSAFYEMLERIAQENEFPVIRVADHLWKAETEVPLWWDTAHFSPYGHCLMAKLLFSEVERAVRTIKDQQRSSAQ